MNQIAGVAGGGPPAKAMHKNHVAGASGSASTKVAGVAGGGGDAGLGAAQIGGGGDLASILTSLTAAVKALGEAVSKLGVAGGGGMAGCPMMGTKVAGVQGGAATRQQNVAVVNPVPGSLRKDEDDAYEQRVLELINIERQKAGLAPVAYNGMLDNSAEKHAVRMADVGKMAHDGIGDGDPGSRARAEGWSKAWGENLATGQTSPEQVVREWMASPTHRRNILDPNFRNMGIAYVTAANGRSYWAQELGA